MQREVLFKLPRRWCRWDSSYLKLSELFSFLLPVLLNLFFPSSVSASFILLFSSSRPVVSLPMPLTFPGLLIFFDRLGNLGSYGAHFVLVLIPGAMPRRDWIQPCRAKPCAGVFS